MNSQLSDWRLSLAAVFALRKLVHLPKKRKGELEIFAFDSHSVLLERTADSVHPGRLSLFFDDQRGHLVLADGFTETSDPNQVRRLIDQTLVLPTRKRKYRGWVSGWMATEPAELAIDATTVHIRADSLVLPAFWQSAGEHWVIFVHGRTAKRAECLRFFDMFSAFGFSNLAISLRNNSEGSNFSNRNSHLGELEWLDVEAAVEWALSHGAKSFTLFGISQGSVSVSEFLRRSALAKHVTRVVLDSPVVDWVAALDFVARQSGSPRGIAQRAAELLQRPTVARLIGLKKPITMSEMGFANWCNAFELPMLILHSRDDGYVPFAPVEKLAAMHHSISLVAFDRWRHVKLFNAQPELYEREVAGFIAKTRPL